MSRLCITVIRDLFCLLLTGVRVKIGSKNNYVYFLLLFFWLAAIFSFADNGATLVTVAGASPAGDFPSLLSGFLPLPFWLTCSFIEDHMAQEYIYIILNND